MYLPVVRNWCCSAAQQRSTRSVFNLIKASRSISSLPVTLTTLFVVLLCTAVPGYQKSWNTGIMPLVLRSMYIYIRMYATWKKGSLRWLHLYQGRGSLYFRHTHHVHSNYYCPHSSIRIVACCDELPSSPTSSWSFGTKGPYHHYYYSTSYS